MQIHVNGETRDVEPGTNLQALLDGMGFGAKSVVVQRNDDVVMKPDYAATLVEEGDSLEIVHFVGGG